MNAMSEHRHFDLDALRLIMLLSEECGLTYSAFVLKMPISTASYKLRKLEKICGQQLLHKVGRSLVLTEAGINFTSRAKKILDANDIFITAVYSDKPNEHFGNVGGRK